MKRRTFLASSIAGFFASLVPFRKKAKAEEMARVEAGGECFPIVTCNPKRYGTIHTVHANRINRVTLVRGASLKVSRDTFVCRVVVEGGGIVERTEDGAFVTYKAT